MKYKPKQEALAKILVRHFSNSPIDECPSGPIAGDWMCELNNPRGRCIDCWRWWYEFLSQSKEEIADWYLIRGIVNDHVRGRRI